MPVGHFADKAVALMRNTLAPVWRSKLILVAEPLSQKLENVRVFHAISSIWILVRLVFGFLVKVCSP